MIPPVKITQALSHSATQLVMCNREAGDATALATGFFWLIEDDVYLVTNWHNLAGRNPLTGDLLSPHAFVPTSVKFKIAFKEKMAGDPEIDGKPVSLIARREINLPLYENETPCWLEHPEFGRNVDVVAIKVGALGDAELTTIFLNTHNDLTDFEIAAGDDVCILGYPRGISGGHGFPIWKRGSVASEPEVPIDGLPKVLVDSATREGLSGAPVIAVRHGLINKRGESGFTSNSAIGTAHAFLGVYSGRVGDDAFGVQLGIVWHARVIDQIIRGGRAGSVS